MVHIALKVYKRIIKIMQKTFSTIYFIQIFRGAKNSRAISPYNSLFDRTFISYYQTFP
jgi:hypothetical protein